MKTDRITVLFGVMFFISLTANLFTAGMIVGGSVSAKVPVTDSLEQQDRQLRDSLSDADKLALKQAMDANRMKITQLYNEIENIKSEIRNLLKQDPMNQKSLGDALEAKKKKELAMLQLVHQARKAAADKMTPEGRKILSAVTRLGFGLIMQCR